MECSEPPRGNSHVPLLDPRHTEIPMLSTSVRAEAGESESLFSGAAFTKIGTATNLNKTHYLGFPEILVLSR